MPRAKGLTAQAAFLCLSILMPCTASTGAERCPALQLLHGLPVDGPGGLHPSGLTWRQGILFAVSDKHDTTIFRVELHENRAVFTPAVRFDVPGPRPIDGLDFEGITCDETGRFYLVSETHCRVLRVTADGAEAAWITPDLGPSGRKSGLFAVWNAGLEGIARVGPHRLVLCAERQPRGLLTVDIGRTPPKIETFRCDRTRLDFRSRAPDFAGLWHDDTGLYAIARNAYVICKLLRTDTGFEEGTGWSYEAVETEPEWRYGDMRYGKAEGLAMDKDRIYLILDNNGAARQSNPTDHRPLLFIFKRPAQ